MSILANYQKLEGLLRAEKLAEEHKTMFKKSQENLILFQETLGVISFFVSITVFLFLVYVPKDKGDIFDLVFILTLFWCNILVSVFSGYRQLNRIFKNFTSKINEAQESLIPNTGYLPKFLVKALRLSRPRVVVLSYFVFIGYSIDAILSIILH